MNGNNKRVNTGIQANNVNAEVIAVGQGAIATKTVYTFNHEKLMNEVMNFRKALEELALSSTAREVVMNDFDGLEKAALKEPPDKMEIKGILQGIAGKLKMVGVVLTEAITLSEPVKKIASMLGTTLKWFGL